MQISRRNFLIILFLVISILTFLLIWKRNTSAVKQHNILHRQIEDLITDSILNSLPKNDALLNFEKAKGMLTHVSDNELAAKVFRNEGNWYKNQELYPPSILAYKNAILHLEKTKKYNSLSKVYYEMADIYKKLGDYNKSMEMCINGLSLAEREGNDLRKRSFYRTLGSVYKYSGNFDLAIENYKKALEISILEGDKNNIGVALNNLGTAYESMGLDSMALNFFIESYNIDSTCIDNDRLATYHNNLGSIYRRMNQNEAAYTNLKLALNYREKAFNLRDESMVLYNLGSYFFGIGQNDSAKLYLSKSIEFAVKGGYKQRIYDSKLLLSKVLLQNNQAVEAYQELLSLREVQQQLFFEQKNIELSKMETRFSEESEKRELQIRRTRQQLILIIISLSLLIVVFLLIKAYKKLHYKLSRQHVLQQEIIQEKNTIEASLETRNRELAGYSLQLARKKEFESSLMENIRSRIGNSNSETQKHLHTILKEVAQESKQYNAWEEFEMRFTQVNQSFYDNLSTQFPELTSNEKRLCALLLLDLNTKEISEITGKSPHSLHVARTRLRNKLGLLNSKQNLSQFLNSFQ